MAAGRLPAPGTEYGPCAEGCKHTDCAETRAMAGSACHWCDQAIGYDTRFYQVKGGFVHASCEEDAAKECRT